jgi:NAD(P)-dependent dehydrogenase (short-subunit alcohol dehydrogenase family)
MMASHILLLVMLLLIDGGNAVRRVLVTGANKGIGREICRRILADVPDSYVILGSRNALRGKDAVRTILKQEPSAEGRIEMVVLDVESDESVAAAVASIAARFPNEPEPLHGLCNNAGIGFGKSIPATLSANYYSQKRVAEAFIPLLNPARGRICNIASASGPTYVRTLDTKLRELFTSPATTPKMLQEELERQARTANEEDVAYGLSKAAVNQWTRQLAREHPSLVINSCSPGYVLTDLTRGMGATNTPEQSNCHVAPLFLLFDEAVPASGWYFGSDAVRSPLDRYRGPGDPPYVAVGDD